MQSGNEFVEISKTDDWLQEISEVYISLKVKD